MQNRILGLHHITAIATSAKRNHDFYTQVLGLRLVKKTVNFDDPGTYHFYYGDGIGSPGSILTFFPWEGIGKGTAGSGMATSIGYAVPAGSFTFWQERFKTFGVQYDPATERMGEQLLPFRDPDCLAFELVVPAHNDERQPWQTEAVKADVGIRGFNSVTLSVRRLDPTAKILTDLFGYTLVKQQGNRYRFATDAVQDAAIVDIIEAPEQSAGRGAAGTNHHVAFRVKDDNVLMEYREKVASKGHSITPKIDRDYFFSLYFREPNGVLFEIATDNPGFTRDEPIDQLGSSLKLPKQYEPSRSEIEKTLPPLV
jgi:glyoxalase family protein